MLSKDARQYLGSEPVFYYDGSQQIFTKDKMVGDRLLSDMRGWGSICNYIRNKTKKLSEEELVRITFARCCKKIR